MIRGLTLLLLFQGVGELISKGLMLPVPGPVIGLVLLVVALVVRGKADPDLDLVAGGLAQHLGLLFVPAAVGVVVFLPQLKDHGLVLALVLVLSVVAAMAVTALVLKALWRRT